MSGTNKLIQIADKYIFVVLSEPSGTDFTFYLGDSEKENLIRQIFDRTIDAVSPFPSTRTGSDERAQSNPPKELSRAASAARGAEAFCDRPFSYSCRIYLLRPWIEEKDLTQDKVGGQVKLLLKLQSTVGGSGDPHYDRIISALPNTCKRLGLPIDKSCLTTLLAELNALLDDGKVAAQFGTLLEITPKEQALLDEINDETAHNRLKAYLHLCSLLGTDHVKPIESRLRCGRVMAALSYEGQVWSLSFREQEVEPGYEPSTTVKTNLNSIAEIAESLYEEIFYVVGDSENVGRGTYSNSAEPPAECNYLNYAARIADHRKSKLCELSGLIVISGSTNSAKSLIARGLIHLYLENVKQNGNIKRRPHLVTLEDPIEKYFASDTYTPADAHPQLQVQIGAAAKEIDYTPRQVGHDVQNLSEALHEALRQTPRVLFVGETRERKDWRALIDFASTGHLIITTAHAGSLVESMHKIFSSTKAKTSSDRAEVAGRLLAVVHLKRTEMTEPRLGVLVPALWRRVPKGVNALTADGLASVLPHSYSQEGDPCSCLGRKYFIERLLEFSKSRLSIGDYSALVPQLTLQALDWDLAGS